MEYLTYFVNRAPKQPEQKDIDYLWDNWNLPEVVATTLRDGYAKTRTILKDCSKLPGRTLAEIPIPEDMSYYEFKIPKRTGGYRTISAPNAELKAAQAFALKVLMTTSAAAHNAAFAYIKERSCKDALEVHQTNKSNWFLKIDLKNFFPSCTEKFVDDQLRKIYPYCNMEPGALDSIFDLCFLNHALPQGAPTSPFLSNLVMIPIDYGLNAKLYNYKGKHFVYTRYADDILISCKKTFDKDEIEGVVHDALKGTPLLINKEKTRYGSKAGSNWNLGLVLNKDNKITVGNQRKRYLSNSLHNLKRSEKQGTPWELEDLYHLQGELSYINSIEPGRLKNFDKDMAWIIRLIKRHTTTSIPPER